MNERRAEIEKLWDQAEKGEELDVSKSSGEETEEEVEKPEEEESKEGEVDEKVEEEKKEEKEEKPDAYKTEKKVAANREEQKQQDKNAESLLKHDSDKAPGSWKPTAREQWSKLPPEIRAEVNRRELQIQQTLSQTDNVRKFANDFAQVVQPYAHLIRQQNSTPLAAVDNLMKTTARLMTGNMEDKATVVAEIIGNHGIDIRVLDKILGGIGVEEGKLKGRVQSQQERPPAWAEPILGFMSTVQQRQAQVEQQAKEEAARAVESFADKPFFEDLREDIADIMEVAARRGRTLTLDQGYDLAVKQRPDIAGIISQRQKASGASDVSKAAATLARARRAASTVHGGPSGSKISNKGEPQSRREAIERAWEEAEDRG